MLTTQQQQQLISDLETDITNLKYVKQLIQDTKWRYKKPNLALVALNARILQNRARIVKLLKEQKGGES